MIQPDDRSRRPAPLPEGGLTVALVANPTAADVSVLERGLFVFEEARLGNPEHAHFAILLRDPAGQVQGGVDGHVMWHRLFVKTAWVAEAWRSRGIGTRLMNAAEAEALRRGCRSVWLTALGDHAAHFYRRMNYETFGVHEDYVAGQALYSLKKDL